MVGAGTYVLSVALLAVVAGLLGFTAVRARRWLLPEWRGAPAHLVDAILGVALLICIAQLLGIAQLLYAWALVAACVAVAAGVLASSRVARGGGAGAARRPVLRPNPDLGRAPSSEAKNPASSRHPLPVTGPAGVAGTPGGGGWGAVVAVGVVAVVFAQWGLTAADAAGRGMFNFDSLWYQMPFAVDMAQSHSVTEFLRTETVFTNWFYPQNSELLHAVGILLTERDTLSLFLNFGWLAVGLLAGWCIGRPYGKGPLSLVAVAVVLDAHTLVVRQPGAAKNDVMAAALILAAVAILVTAAAREGGERSWLRAVAMAGLAAGLAAGTKSTAFAMAAVLSVAVLALAPAGRRGAAAAWWFLPALAGGGYWYLRNLVATGNPLPQLESIGPISLPHPERLQTGRPDFSVAHYLTDTAVWREYFGPGLDNAFGALWSLVVVGAVAGGLYALVRGSPAMTRWVGAAALLGLLAYLFTPLGAAGAEGAPEGFGINIRYAIPALLAGFALLPLAVPARSKGSGRATDSAGVGAGDVPLVSRPYGRLTNGTSGPGRVAGLWWWAALVAGVLVLVATDRADAVVRDPDRVFAWVLAVFLVLVPAALLCARRRGVPRGAVATGFALLAVAVAAIGYPVQRHYLEDRFANRDPATAIPGMELDSAYRWARDLRDSRIGLAGTTAGFHGYGFHGTDLSNEVVYLGREGPRGAFAPIATCAGFRAAVNAADLDYLVTAPFLNFIEPEEPVPSPEARWLRGEGAVRPLDREGAVTVWRVGGKLDPTGCGPTNAPLLEVPRQPIPAG